MAAALVTLSATGCGVSSYTQDEAKDATSGEDGYLIVDEPELMGSLRVRLIEDIPRYAVTVEFHRRSPEAPRVSGLRVGMTWMKGVATIWVPPEALEIVGEQCGGGAPCAPLRASAFAGEGVASRALPGDLDDFTLTIAYTVDRGNGPESVSKRIRAHPSRPRTHHYFWIFRDC